MPAKKHVRGVDDVPTTVTLTAAPMTSRAGLLRVDLTSNWDDHDAYRRQRSDPGKAEHAGARGRVDLDALSE